MDFLPDGRLVVSTRRGRVWIVENALADDPAGEARFELFAEGCGRASGWRGGRRRRPRRATRRALAAAGRVDGDGTSADHVDTIADGWGLSGNYHEFAFGLPVDDDGNFYVGLNVAFFSPKWWHGKSPVPWRGWVLRIAPDGNDVAPSRAGSAVPCGLGLNAAGRPVRHRQPGRLDGGVADLPRAAGGRLLRPPGVARIGRTSTARAAGEGRATPRRPRAPTDQAPAAVWLPYKWSRSAGNLVDDSTGGRFGAVRDQLFVAELTNGMVLRVHAREGARRVPGRVPSLPPATSARCRVCFAPDGTLFCRADQPRLGRAPAGGRHRARALDRARRRWRSLHQPLQDGFEIGFTLPLAERRASSTPESVALTQYDYDYWWEYGSPERATCTTIEVTRVELERSAAARRSARTAGLDAGHGVRAVELRRRARRRRTPAALARRSSLHDQPVPPGRATTSTSPSSSHRRRRARAARRAGCA